MKLFTSKVMREGETLVMLMQPELLDVMELEDETVYAWHMQDDGSFLVAPFKTDNNQDK